MTPIKKLIDMGLISWPTILLGLKNGWACRQDVIDYAVSLLMTGSDDENVAVIAAGEFISDDELIDLVSAQSKDEETGAELDKWRLAYLICIAESDTSEQKKIDDLQQVYSQFDYPEDMASCSIYAQDNVDPLMAMMKVVKELRKKLLLK